MVVDNNNQQKQHINMDPNDNNLLIKEEECEEEELFPIDDLKNLDEMLNRPRWLVPVLPKQELELLLEKSIDLCKKGLDVKSQACKRFYRDGLLQSFIKILTDDAVASWKLDIYKCIYNNSLKAIELCVLKLNNDNTDIDNCLPLLDLLAMLFNPNCKYHLSNSIRNNDIDIDSDNEYSKSYNKSPYV
jgi:ubiquitin carboxyl-terminal hydrolase 9/24